MAACHGCNVGTAVALRKESVDRNAEGCASGNPARVALRKESVDRNAIQGVDVYQVAASLSVRRAWIEMVLHSLSQPLAIVALRKESVDRNMARLCSRLRLTVALRKESVDRNAAWTGCLREMHRRSP